MYSIEKIDIMEKLLRKVGSNHEPEALDAARRLKILSNKWGISLDALHSTSSEPTNVLRRRARRFWDKEARQPQKARVNQTTGENQ
ncbi:MAG: hypothetical protein HY912_01630 [Desulfomonile tiedjei]|uniref:Uncharacterized protein n=1 Tax=Desulfomonile tiedjei TaxID=2358 RepID=A0A9D6V007_9BACT|nr:hypothetical protein [Desulfomonile tiedjei]